MSSISADTRIGELARCSGLASTALRYYEKAGLLPQSRRSSSSGLPYVPTRCRAAPGVHPRGAGLGLTLAEIRELIGIRDAGAAPCAQVLQLIEKHRAEVRSRIRELQRLERDLDHLASRGGRRRSVGVRSRRRLQGHSVGCRPGSPDEAAASCRCIVAAGSVGFARVPASTNGLAPPPARAPATKKAK